MRLSPAATRLSRSSPAPTRRCCVPPRIGVRSRATTQVGPARASVRARGTKRVKPRRAGQPIPSAGRPPRQDVALSEPQPRGAVMQQRGSTSCRSRPVSSRCSGSPSSTRSATTRWGQGPDRRSREGRRADDEKRRARCTRRRRRTLTPQNDRCPSRVSYRSESLVPAIQGTWRSGRRIALHGALEQTVRPRIERDDRARGGVRADRRWRDHEPLLAATWALEQLESLNERNQLAGVPA